MSDQKVLPLYPGAKPCIRSGYCCKVAPCAFGTWDEKNKQCQHLIKDKDNQYACGIFDQIIQKTGWELNPAFGAGCCSSRNSDRQKLLAEKRRAEKDSGNGNVPKDANGGNA